MEGLQALTKDGKVLPVNENETHVFYNGEWEEVCEDQDGDLYFRSGKNTIYMDYLTPIAKN